MSLNGSDSEDSCAYVNIKQVHFESPPGRDVVPSYAKGLLSFQSIFLIKYTEFETLKTACAYTYKVAQNGVTFKAPNKNCSRRHFNFLLLSFEENKA